MSDDTDKNEFNFQVRVLVKWQLKAENGKDIICVLIPAKIE